MSNRPPIEEQIAFYDKWNKEHRNDRYENIHEEIRCRADKILELIDEHDLPTNEILEIGCGTGWFTEELSRRGAVTAIDLSPQAVAMAGDRQTGAICIAGNVLEYDFGGKQFDLIVCVETLFYVEDPVRLVQRMSELCKSGGHLALSTINKFVYERSHDVGPPEKGQIRNWMSRLQTRQIIERFFDLIFETTVAPRGHKGILRIINSYRLNRLLGRWIGDRAVQDWKERLGLGGGVIFLAQKKD